MSSILMNGAPGSFSRQQSFKPPPMGAFAFAPAHPSSLGAGASVHSLQSSKTKNHANPMQRGGEKTAVPAHHQAKHSAANHHRGASVEVSNDRRRTSLDLLHPQGSASANVQVRIALLPGFLFFVWILVRVHAPMFKGALSIPVL